MTTDTPNLNMLVGIVSTPTLRGLKKWNRMKQSSAFKRTVLQLRKELGDTQETQAILEAIKPIPE